MKLRLNKFIASCGICSRRKADEIIKNGKIRVNGQICNEVGTIIDTEKDVVKYYSKILKMETNKIYIIMNKPLNCITSTKRQDPNVKTVFAFLPKFKERIFPVGRLDKNTTGLLLLTNDGELTNALLHPKRKIPKTYRVVAKGNFFKNKIESLRQGVILEDGVTLPAKVFINKKISDELFEFKITIFEGRKRQIRRMFKAVDMEVVKLHRIGFAGLSVKGLKKGEWRFLTHGELVKLKKSVGLE